MEIKRNMCREFQKMLLIMQKDEANESLVSFKCTFYQSNNDIQMQAKYSCPYPIKSFFNQKISTCKNFFI